MAKPLDPRIQDILKQYHPNPRAAVWDCHGTTVIYHKDVEIVAAAAGIVFDKPTVLEANGKDKCVALCVTAYLGDRSDWSVGEAAPGNNKNAYPYAMAEKRARDRVVLKLLGLAGFVYSEDESEDFKPPQQAEQNRITQDSPPAPMDQETSKVTRDVMIKAIGMAQSMSDLTAWARDNKKNFGKMMRADFEAVKQAIDDRENALTGKEAA